MPDWSYHSLFKPILFRLKPETARRITLQAVAVLGRAPGGGVLIDFMAKIDPDPALKYQALELEFPGRVGLAAGLCRDAATIKAFQHFGFGFIETGPVTLHPVNVNESLKIDIHNHSIIAANAPINDGVDNFVATALSALPAKGIKTPLFVRTAHAQGTDNGTAIAEAKSMIEKLPSCVDALTIDSRWCFDAWTDEEVRSYLTAVVGLKRSILTIAADTEESSLLRIVQHAVDAGIQGVSITGGIMRPSDVTANSTERVYGQAALTDVLRVTGLIKTTFPDLCIIAAEGITEPGDALDLLANGADMIGVYSGLVFSGPGLAKRINELITAARPDLLTMPPQEQWASPYSWQRVLAAGWIGFTLIGAGLIITGSSAITVALTTVILPYDEKFLGMTRAAMITLNSNLLPFLSHDRVTYAGAGMSGGLMFAALSFFGARNGQRWAYIAARNSCAFGFFSFLLFLGFHYLDPLHALVTLLLVPFFIWGLIKAPPTRPMKSSNTTNDPDWLNGLYGQFWFVCIGLGLILAGITICKVGTSTVFVAEDLMFMHTTAHDILNHNTHLLPTIAHDRAGFGGSLVTVGIAVLLTSLHGFRQGEGWVWWMLLVSGLPGFVSTLAIHYAIGYTSFIHLLPAYIACAMFIGALTLCYRYLCVRPGPDALIGSTK